MGNRTSLADNATINSTRIATLAQMFMSSEQGGVRIAKDLHADYILIFVAGQKVEDQNLGKVYVLGGGGEESKKQWFIRIGGFTESDFLYDDAFTPKPNLWDNSLLGKLMPFKLNNYIDADGKLVGGDWASGRNALYTYQMNYPADGDGPLRLVFESSSINQDAQAGIYTGVLIYKINSDYIFP